MKKLGYPIRAVSKLTGLSIDTLRSWERRYHAVVPGRNGTGRTYSEADVQKLRLLREVVERGYSIGQIANLSEEELKQIAGQAEEVIAGKRSPLAGGVSTSAGLSMQAVQEAIKGFDYFKADME